MRRFQPCSFLLAGLLLTLSAATALSQGGSCAMPGGTLAAPDCDCRLQSGDTSVDNDGDGVADGSDFWAIDLVAGATYTFTLCDGTCPGAGADFDTRLRAYDPGCVLIAQADDTCGFFEELQITAGVTGTYVIEVTSFFTGDVGTYTLAWREGGPPPSCANTNGTLTEATTDCQTLDDEICSGDDAYYTVNLETGLTYTFTLCDTTCAGAGASFPSALELYTPGGALAASGDDECGDQAEIVHTVDPADGGGAWCVRVNRNGGGDDTFTFGWFVECQAPQGLVVGPETGSTSAEDCGNDVLFGASTSGTGPFDWSWVIVPLTGDGASPDTFSETTDGATSAFLSTLTGDGTFEVTVTVTNECGSMTETIVYTLEDRRGPDLDCSAEPCVVPAPSPDRAPTAAGPSVVAMAVASAEPETWSPPRELDLAGIKAALIAEADPGEARGLVAAKLGITPNRVVVRDGREPALRRPPTAAAVGCATPCESGTIEELHPFYDVYLNCFDGSFTARTGASHSVTIGSGAPQNVIFGGAGGTGSTTSDVAWRVHDDGTTYLDPAGGAACAFNPPDTPAEPNSEGLEMEWPGITPMPGVTLTLREEIVAFGDVEANSGIRMTLGATNEPSSIQSVNMGVRWQIDYKNASDDGPLYSRVSCDPFDVFDERSTEHEFDQATEVDDFYRIQNNTGTPIFGNFTSTAPIAGFPDTAKPDRLIYGPWGSLLSSPWNYAVNEGANADFDSATLVYYGYLPADGITIDPGETFTRSVVIFTQGEEQDCGSFVPGEGVNAETRVCPGDCATIGAEASDNCSDTTVVLVDSSPGAPPCVGNPCVVDFPDEGTFEYTWEATDAQGNSTLCVSTIAVVDDGSCNQPPSCQAGPGYSSGCRVATIDGATAEDPDEDELTWEWTSSDPLVVLSPAAGVLAAGPGDRAIPAVTATLDPSIAPCGFEATLTLTVTDPSGEISTCEAVVTFSDTEPPTVIAPEGPSACAWSPNHSYVCIETAALEVSVADSCTEASWRLIGCASDQPDEAPDDASDFNGDGNFEDDCVVSPDGSMVCVRAERAGGGAASQDGRTYTLLGVAIDECGNESEPLPAATIHVPHDQSPAEREGCLDPTKAGLKKGAPFPWDAGTE